MGKKQKVLVTLSALKNESGEIVAVATIAKDITELKAAEVELRQLVGYILLSTLNHHGETIFTVLIDTYHTSQMCLQI